MGRATGPQLTPAQVGDQLGVSYRTVYRYVADGLLDHIQIGRGKRSRIRIPQSSVDRFVEKRFKPGRHAA